MPDDKITHLGHIALPDESDGHWRTATCAEYEQAILDAGGYDALTVWSALTDLDGTYGPPTLYTCWGERGGGRLVAATISDPRGNRPWHHTDAVFVPAGQR